MIVKVFEKVHPSRLEVLLRVYANLGYRWEILPNGRFFTVVFTQKPHADNEIIEEE